MRAGSGERDTCSSCDEKQMVHMAPAPRGENLSAEPQLRSHTASQGGEREERGERSDNKMTVMHLINSLGLRNVGKNVWFNRNDCIVNTETLSFKE